jgi:MFS family permease
VVHNCGMDLETREWLQGRIDGRLAAGIGIAWLVTYQVAVSLEPVTHKPEPWYGVVLGVTFLALIAGMVTGLVMQQRWGIVLSVAAAAFFTALSVACPVSGHHPFGAWWFGQMACALGMLGGSIAALNRSSHRDAAPEREVAEAQGVVAERVDA